MSPRFLAVLVAMGLAGLAAPAPAKQAEPNVTLHIEASAQIAPDRVVLPLRLSTQGDSNAAAEAGLAKQEAEVRQQLAEFGINAARIKLDGDVSFVTMAAVCPAGEAAVAQAAPSVPRRGKARAAAQSEYCSPEAIEANKTMLVEVDGSETVDRVLRSPLAEMAAGGRRSIIHSQSDPVAARKKARGQAIAKARAEAEAYADALGYRVVRIERVSNARPAMNMNDLIAFIATMEDRSSRIQPGWFGATITETVAIDFVIAPK